MTQIIKDPLRWTTADIESLAADEWKRYEIIDGELFVTRAPHISHQGAAGRIYARYIVVVRRNQPGSTYPDSGLDFL